MAIKSDRWIRHMAEQGMIEPFEAYQVRNSDYGRIISYGTSSYGYDVRCADEFKIFTNINSAIVDPKNFDPNSFVDLKSDVCIIPPNSFVLARTVEYFRIPRNVLVLCTGKSTYARCFRGDTRIALVDGSAPTLEKMATRTDQGELFWGYSIGANGRLIVTQLEAPRYVGRDSLIEVKLDNEKSIFATPDHLFMLRDGHWIAAGELNPGASLMPLYRQIARGYETVYQPLNGHFYPTHRLADEWNLRHGLYEDAPKTQCHHVDVDRFNNNPWNIVRIGAEAHIQLHNGKTYEDEFDSDAYRGATRLLNFDRAVFRRFPHTIDSFRGNKTVEKRNHKVVSVRHIAGDHDVFCLTVPEAGNFALDNGVFVHNCGIIVNVTPLEPEWEGHVTLEFSNTTPLPAKIYANEGIAQILFFESDEVCETSYKDRNGKYQGQRGVTLPKS